MPAFEAEAVSNETFARRLEAIAASIRLGMDCDLIVGQDTSFYDAYGEPDGRFYLQITCWRRDAITGEMGRGYGGKAYLSPHMTDSELIQIAFGLYKGYWEHEARETFVLINFDGEGRRPFGPHIDTWALWGVARRVDVRSARHVGDRPNRD
uniref:Tail terminator n=2 Tax=unclassified bacterial viruses TaxID=12333 RepID=A0AAU7J844_9VIRU